MISIKSDYEISLMKIAGNIVYNTIKIVGENIKPGVTTYELNRIAEDYIRNEGAIPSCLGYQGYPASICTSVNEEVVHGIPSKKRKLKEGDIIDIDVVACYKGYHADACKTFAVGKISQEKQYLLEHTEKALYVGLEQVKPGNRVGDIGYAIESYARKHKLGVVRELVGHGIGSSMHENPDIPNYGEKGTGPVLKEGMCIAVEPMLNLGTEEVFMLDDDWTIVTGDGKPSAHFEHSVVVTKDGYEILTGDDSNE